MVSGVDFWCKLHYFPSRGRSRGSRGPKGPRIDKKPGAGFIILFSPRSAQVFFDAELFERLATSRHAEGGDQSAVCRESLVLWAALWALAAELRVRCKRDCTLAW